MTRPDPFETTPRPVPPWTEVFDPERLDGIRTMIALHPANTGQHDTSRLAHLHLSRLLADMGDIDEAAITAVVAAATAGSIADEGPCSLSSALERTWRMRLNQRYVLACLASAVLRSNDRLHRMERTRAGTSMYPRKQVEAQRRDAQMTLHAFHSWERITTGRPVTPAPSGSPDGPPASH